MHRGGAIVNRRSREDLLKAIRDAPGKMKEVYRSDSALIQRVDMRVGGSYFIVVESDMTTGEDELALGQLVSVLGGSWRNRIVETDFFGRKHPDFPWSSSFSVHVLHPECPPGEPRRSVLV